MSARDPRIELATSLARMVAKNILERGDVSESVGAKLLRTFLDDEHDFSSDSSSFDGIPDEIVGMMMVTEQLVSQWRDETAALFISIFTTGVGIMECVAEMEDSEAKDNLEHIHGHYSTALDEYQKANNASAAVFGQIVPKDTNDPPAPKDFMSPPGGGWT